MWHLPGPGRDPRDASKIVKVVVCSSRDAQVLYGDSGEAVWSPRATGAMEADEVKEDGKVTVTDTQESSTDTSRGR